MFDGYRSKSVEGARKHPMWAGTVTPANIWRMQEEINVLSSEIVSLKDKINELEAIINEHRTEL